MTDRTVTLTPDELDALLQDLERDHGEHDFEPECPACTGTRKLRAALAAGMPQVAVAQPFKLCGWCRLQREGDGPAKDCPEGWRCAHLTPEQSKAMHDAGVGTKPGEPA